MKIIAGLTGVAAAVILGGYYGMGVVTEHTIKNNLDFVNQSNGVAVKVLSYDRGWFTSNADIAWKAHVPQRMIKTVSGQTEMIPAQDLEMNIPLTIYHGPIIFANKRVKFGLGYAHTDLPLPNKYNEQFASKFTADSTKPSVSLNLLVNYFNNSNIELSVPNFKLTRKEGGQLNWLGMTSDMTVSKNAQKISGNFELAGVELAKDDTKAVIGKITSDYKLHKTNDGLYLGNATINMPIVNVNQGPQKIFELKDFTMYTDSDIDNGLFDSHLKLSLNNLYADGKNYGPAKIAMSITKLDAVVLARINQQANQVQQGSMLEKQQALLAVLPEVPKLFSRGAEVEVSDFNMVVPQGVIDGNLKLSLPVNDSNNPFELIQKVEGKSTLTVPAEIVREVLNESNKQKALKEQAAAAVVANSAVPGTATSTTPVTALPALTDEMAKQVNITTETQLNTMVQSGLVVRDGDKLTINLTIHEGKLFVNDKPYDSEMTKF